MLLGRRERLDDTESCSVRRFSSFGLLSTDFVKNDAGNTWYRYNAIASKDYAPSVRYFLLSEAIKVILLYAYSCSEALSAGLMSMLMMKQLLIYLQTS